MTTPQQKVEIRPSSASPDLSALRSMAQNAAQDLKAAPKVAESPAIRTNYQASLSSQDVHKLDQIRSNLGENSPSFRKAKITYDPSTQTFHLRSNFSLSSDPVDKFASNWQQIANKVDPSLKLKISKDPLTKIESEASLYHLSLASFASREEASKLLNDKNFPSSITKDCSIQELDGKFSVVFRRFGREQSIQKEIDKLKSNPLDFNLVRIDDAYLPKDTSIIEGPKQSKQSLPLSKNMSCQNAVESLVNNAKNSGKLRKDENISVYAIDTAGASQLCDLHSNDKHQLASVVKIYVAAAYMKLHSQNADKYPYGKTEKHHMEEMLRNSNNDSTNFFFRKIGVSRVQTISENFGLKPNIVENIPPGGQTYKNSASAKDVAKLLLLIANDQIPGSAEIKKHMQNHVKSRLWTRAKDIPSDQHGNQYNKTGTTGMAINDSGFHIGTGKDYVVVVLVDRKTRIQGNEPKERLGNFIGEISGAIYKGTR